MQYNKYALAFSLLATYALGAVEDHAGTHEQHVDVHTDDEPLFVLAEDVIAATPVVTEHSLASPHVPTVPQEVRPDGPENPEEGNSLLADEQAADATALKQAAPEKAADADAKAREQAEAAKKKEAERLALQQAAEEKAAREQAEADEKAKLALQQAAGNPEEVKAAVVKPFYQKTWFMVVSCVIVAGTIGGGVYMFSQRDPAESTDL